MMSALEVAGAAIETYNRHDLDAFERLHNPDADIEFAGYPDSIDLAEWISVLDRLFASLPDLTIRPINVLADDATVVIEMRQFGTNSNATRLDDATRALFGVDVPGVVVLAIADGRVVGERHHWPPQWFWQQLGFVSLDVVPTGRATDLARAAGRPPRW